MKTDFEKLIAAPPSRVGELAAALDVSLAELLGDGKLTGFVVVAYPDSAAKALRTLRLSFAWDFHHDQPIASEANLGDRQLQHYVADFNEGRAACEAALRAVFGEPSRKRQGPSIFRRLPGRIGAVPRSSPERTRSYRQYGPFFIEEVPNTEDDRLSLEWFASEPDWAKPAVDAQRRKDALRGMAKRIARSSTADQIRQAIEQRPEDVGMRLTAQTTSEGTNHGVAMEPPISALDFADAFGLRKCQVQALNHHQNRWEVLVPRWTIDWRRMPLPLRRRLLHPRLGKWRVEASLDDAPTGTELEDGYALAEDDVIRFVIICPDEP